MPLVLLILALEVADLALTRWGVTQGLIKEGNPILEGLVFSPALLWLKIAGGLTLAWLAHHSPGLKVVILAGLDAVLVWNVVAISMASTGTLGITT